VVLGSRALRPGRKAPRRDRTGTGTGGVPDWEQAVVPEEERPVVLDSFVHHYEAYETSD
jgi:hypothetical protein